jgi:hypothetical protein
MIVYSYSPQTGEFIGTEAADPSPLETGVWLVPANATTVVPPATQAGKAIVWNGTAWRYVKDVRGETWYGGADGRQPFLVTGLGDPADSGLTSTPRAPTQDEMRADLLAYAGRKRRAVEEGGTTVNGLRYESDRTTQQMLTSAVLAAQAVGGPTEFKWKTADGFVTLTAEQVQAIAVVVSLHVQAAFATEAEVAAGILDGTVATIEAIDAAAWPG